LDRRNSSEARGTDIGLDQDLYLISMAARMLGMHPQTLRKYERLGLVQPSRTLGSMRLYSRDELERLKVIKRLVDDGGINLAGVQRLLSIAEVVQRIRPLVKTSMASGMSVTASPARREPSQSARAARRRLGRELDELLRMLGMD
jgi:MerR family transcriptional regulator/heat shock protein HspR